MSEPMRASLMVWQWTCDGEQESTHVPCGITAFGTFDEFAASGWVERFNQMTQRTEQFCPRCSRGWGFVGVITPKNVEETPATTQSPVIE